MDVWTTVKEFMKFKNPTDRLIAALFGAVLVLGLWAKDRIESEEKKRLDERAYYDGKFKQEQAASDIRVSKAEKEAEDARKAISECEKSSLAWAKELLAEQKQVNGRTKRNVKTSTKVTVENRQLSREVVEQQKQLSETLKE